MGIYRPPADDHGRGQHGGNKSDPAPSRLAFPPQDIQFSDGFLAPPRPSHRPPGRTAPFHDFANEVNENPYVREFNKFRLLCGKVVNHPRVQLFIISLIVINAIMMGVATFDFVTKNPAVENAFEVTDEVFLAIFTVELFMQFAFNGHHLFWDGWLVFDFVIVIVSWSFTQEGVQFIRAFRIFRALRIINRIETMRNLVTALFDIMPRLGAITALMALIFYIFAVLFTQLFGDLELTEDYFSRLDYSVLTLFAMMTMEWAEVGREVMLKIWWAWVPIVVFIMITGFIVFNLIIAVVCDAVAVIENKEHLQGEFLRILGSSNGSEDDESDGRVPSHRMNNDRTEENEEDLVENLAERISSALNSQKNLLSTLELLVNNSLVETPAAWKQGGNSHVEEVKMPEH